jgi:sugar phosphate isomerase/epimerase
MKGYGLRWVEIRNVWGIYNTEASSAQIARLKELLVKYEFKVSVVDTALFKCALPGTRPAEDAKDVYPYAEQMDLLKRASDRAHAFGTDKLRGFAFWRVAEPEKLYPRIAEELERAAEVARRAGVRLMIEDEGSCNVGTGRELALLLKNVAASNVGANWDVGNGCWHGEAPFPTGYEALPKQRLWHLHVKGVQCASGFKDCQETFADQGQIDLLGQFRALVRDGYQETISLECEFEAPGLSHQETTRRSLEGLLKVMASALT